MFASIAISGVRDPGLTAPYLASLVDPNDDYVVGAVVVVAPNGLAPVGAGVAEVVAPNGLAAVAAGAAKVVVPKGLGPAADGGCPNGFELSLFKPNAFVAGLSVFGSPKPFEAGLSTLVSPKGLTGLSVFGTPKALDAG